MIPLSLSSQTLQVSLSTSPVSTQPTMLAAFYDQNKDGNQTKWAINVTTFAGTANVTSVPAPQQTFTRCIESLHISNPDVSSVIAIFKLNDGGTATNIQRLTIPAGRSGGYEDGSGWYAT